MSLVSMFMNTQYIFVTGGVVSGLGKGITAASVGLILKSSGYAVDIIKFDPYLNVDPGTMSPVEHGEVYVLNDGSETDLDLGHYERFLDINLTSNSSVTAGKIYSNILDMERAGVFLGKNVQLIPNVTSYIKECFSRESKNIDVRIIEIGGSVGDMEGEIFLEAIRQFKREAKVLHIHLGYVPFLGCSREYKTKPFQNSLKELLRTGLQPNLLIARYEKQATQDINQDQLEKLALFGNVEAGYVLPVPDFSSIYEVPNHLIKVGICSLLSDYMKNSIRPDIPEFFLMEGKSVKPTKRVRVAVVGKYGSKLSDADYSVMQSLTIAGFYAGCEVESEIILADDLMDEGDLSWTRLKSCDSILVLGGFGLRGMEGKIKAIEYARISKKPFLGICLGMQMAVVEFARNVCGIQAISAEMLDGEKSTPEDVLVVDYMKSQIDITKKGGTMRLGAYQCDLTEGSLIQELYTKSQIVERHRHRLEVQSQYIDILGGQGMKITGKYYYQDEEGEQQFLPEMLELDRSLHPYFVATQSHPEMLSRPTNPHPLFLGLINQGLKLNQNSKK